jgi:large subunit ribosomal protein L2
MNAVDHPFGGNSPGCGRNKEIKRTASPGMKVGNIASKRSGIRKR